MSIRSENLNELSLALAKAQSQIQGAKKDSVNPFFKSGYADLSSVWEACRDALTKNNLSIIQTTEVTEKGVLLVTTLTHSSGQWVSGHYPVRPQKEDPQALGAALTYARRYALAAMVGVCSIEDDDAESAMQRGTTKSTATPRAEGEYVIPFGKFKGKGLAEVKPNDLLNYCDFLEKKANEEKKDITGAVKEFLDRVGIYLSEK